MLDLLHPVTVSMPATACSFPASTPHCIDAGVFIVELQEPTDFSVLLEWDGFDIDGPADGHLGLGFDVALDAVRTDAFDGADVDRLVRRADAAEHPARARVAAAGPAPTPTSAPGRSTRRRDAVTVPAAFSVVVVTDGDGHAALGRRRRRRSHAATPSSSPTPPAPLTFDGGVTAVVAQPPAPDARPNPSRM